MSWTLKSSLQVDDVGMINPSQNGFLTLDMLNLLQPNNFTLLKTLQSQRQALSRLITMFNQPDPTKSTSPKGTYEIEIIKLKITSLLPLIPSLFILRSIKGWGFRVV